MKLNNVVKFMQQQVEASDFETPTASEMASAAQQQFSPQYSYPQLFNIATQVLGWYTTEFDEDEDIEASYNRTH